MPGSSLVGWGKKKPSTSSIAGTRSTPQPPSVNVPPYPAGTSSTGDSYANRSAPGASYGASGYSNSAAPANDMYTGPYSMSGSNPTASSNTQNGFYSTSTPSGPSAYSADARGSSAYGAGTSSASGSSYGNASPPNYGATTPSYGASTPSYGARLDTQLRDFSTWLRKLDTQLWHDCAQLWHDCAQLRHVEPQLRDLNAQLRNDAQFQLRHACQWRVRIWDSSLDTQLRHSGNGILSDDSIGRRGLSLHALDVERIFNRFNLHLRLDSGNGSKLFSAASQQLWHTVDLRSYA